MQSYNTYKQNQPHSKSRTVELWAPVSYQISNSNKKWAKNVKRKQLRRDENERDDDRDKQKNVQERNIKKNLIASLITACKEIAKKIRALLHLLILHDHFYAFHFIVIYIFFIQRRILFHDSIRHQTLLPYIKMYIVPFLLLI